MLLCFCFGLLSFHLQGGFVKVGELTLSTQEYNNWRGKFGRACCPKPTSGRLDVPKEIHEIFLAKGKVKTQMFEQFVRANGDKDWGRSTKYMTGARILCDFGF